MTPINGIITRQSVSKRSETISKFICSLIKSSLTHLNQNKGGYLHHMCLPGRENYLEMPEHRH